VAERGRGMVEDHREMGRLAMAVAVLLADLEVLGKLVEHVAEARERADRQPVRLARERRQRVIRAEDEGRAVDENEVHGERSGALAGRAAAVSGTGAACRSRVWRHSGEKPRQGQGRPGGERLLRPWLKLQAKPKSRSKKGGVSGTVLHKGPSR